ncbi:hypothetical protein LCGC14_2435720, partial [marine sediment metagenome]
WHSGQMPNHGFLLKGSAAVASGEWPVEAYRPKLIVDHGERPTGIPALKGVTGQIELDPIAKSPDAGQAKGDYGTVRVGQGDGCLLRGRSRAAYVKDNTATYPGPWGWMTQCRVGGVAGDVSRTLLYFDLREIPSTASVKSAKLVCSLVGRPRQIRSYRYGAFALNLPDSPGWSADEAVAGERAAGKPWPDGGVTACSSAKPLAIAQVVQKDYKDRRGRTRRRDAEIAFDLTGAVRAWVAGKAPNCGVLLDNRLAGGAYDIYGQRAWDPKLRPYLEIELSPGVDSKPTPIAEVTTAPAGRQWIQAMRKVHAKFKGKKGRCVLYGDSITYSMAFLGTAAYGKDITYKNIPPEAKADIEAVWAYADRAFWQKRHHSLGHEGQKKSDWFLARIDGWQKTLQPEVCAILFGTNDLGGLCPPDYTENMAAAINLVSDALGVEAAVTYNTATTDTKGSVVLTHVGSADDITVTADTAGATPGDIAIQYTLDMSGAITTAGWTPATATAPAEILVKVKADAWGATGGAG